MHCPFCDASNHDGAATCVACGQDLTSFNGKRSSGRSDLERARLEDAQLLEPIILAPSAPVGEAVRRMRQRRLGSVFIVEEDRLVGVFTEADLLARVEPAANLEGVPLAGVMTRQPAHYKKSDTLNYAVNAMTSWGKRHLPIVDEAEQLQGFVGIRTVLTLIQERCRL